MAQMMEDVKVNGSSKNYYDFEVDFSKKEYTYFKIDATENSNQIRITSFGLVYQEDLIFDSVLHCACDNLNNSLFDKETTSETFTTLSFNNIKYGYNYVTKDDNDNLVINEKGSIYNIESYGIIDKIIIDSIGEFNLVFIDKNGHENSFTKEQNNYMPIRISSHFKISSIGEKITIKNFLVYYKPIANIYYQYDNNGTKRLVSELKDLSNNVFGFVVNDEKIYIHEAKRKIIVNGNKITTTSFYLGYFFTYELDNSIEEATINAFVKVNEFQTVYLLDRDIT